MRRSPRFASNAQTRWTRRPLDSLDVAIRIVGGKAERRIEQVLTIAGLDQDQQARLAEIAERTPVTLTLKGGIAIRTTIAAQG